MADSIATVVDWYGPYKNGVRGLATANAQAAARDDYTAGLYVAVGHGEQLRRGPRTLLYVGISANLGIRVSPTHETLQNLSIQYMAW